MVCIKCGKDISEQDPFCRHCGQRNEQMKSDTKVKEQAEVQRIEQEITAKLTKKCPACGKQYTQDRFFCDECGSNLVTMELLQSTDQQGDICSNCGSKIPENMLFCGKCGTKVTPVKKEIHCSSCGAGIEEGMIFCGKCGARVNSTTNTTQQYQMNTYTNDINKSNNYTGTYPSSVETELYRKNNVGYYKTLTQITGLFLITNKKITFTPSALYVLSKPFTIDMKEILTAERASVMGINLCIKVITTTGKSHTFALGLLNAGDIQNVVDIINRTKQGGMR